jgi:amidase
VAAEQTDDLIFSSATALARLIGRKEISSRDVVETHLRRIEAVNPDLNAIAVLAAETALAEADAADAAIAADDAAGPLLGVPFTVKDWIETEGAVCAAGFEERADFVPRRDATVVARMRKAGAIMLGKTSVLADSEFYGRVSNPYDLARSPGASSSGEAAIIAAGGSPLGLGSDSGGSIRVPSHFCGIAGLRPTSGRVPNTGHFPRIGALSDPRTQIGPMARSVEDLALTLPIIAGEDWRDPSVVPMPIDDPGAVEISDLRVAFYTDIEGASPTSETLAVVRDCIAALSDAGAGVTEAQPKRLDESLAITHTYWRRERSVAWNEWQTDGESMLTASKVERSLFEWDRFRRSLIAFMETTDVIVTPVSSGPADLHGTPYDDSVWVYTLPYSLTGWPCVVVRAGTSPEGLPIGVQIVARPWREDVALAVAQRVEVVLGGWQRPSL